MKTMRGGWKCIPTDKERLRPILIFERFKVINFTNIPSADAQFLWFCGLPLFWALEEPLVSSLISAAADKVSPRVYIDICYKLISSKVSKRTLSWVFWSKVFYFWHQTSLHEEKKKINKKLVEFQRSVLQELDRSNLRSLSMSVNAPSPEDYSEWCVHWPPGTFPCPVFELRRWWLNIWTDVSFLPVVVGEVPRSRGVQVPLSSAGKKKQTFRES